MGPSLLRWRQSMSLHAWHCQGPHKPSSCATFTLNTHWGRAATGKKMSCIYACRVASVVSKSLRPCRLWPARLLCQGAGWFSRQEYWRALASTAFHTLLEHFVSCCPSCQLPLGTWCCQNPCNPSSCITSTPGPHRGKPKSSRAALGANPRG